MTNLTLPKPTMCFVSPGSSKRSLAQFVGLIKSYSTAAELWESKKWRYHIKTKGALYNRLLSFTMFLFVKTVPFRLYMYIYEKMGVLLFGVLLSQKKTALESASGVNPTKFCFSVFSNFCC